MSTTGDAGKGGDPEWTMSDERAMQERIVYHRFNFFMVLITVIATSILRTDSRASLKLALGMGLGLSVLFFFSLRKHQRRLNAAQNLLAERPEHPVAILERVLGPESNKGIIGVAIPLVCITSLLIANLLVWLFPHGWPH